MGLFCSTPKVYKPASEVNLGPDSDEIYISPNVQAPRVAGFLVKIFAWVLEMPIVGSIVLYILKKDNLVNKLVLDAEIPELPLFNATHSWQDIPEQNVNLTKPDLSPAERVQEAVSCLPARLESTLADPSSGFKHRTMRDFAKAYSSGEITPVMVAKRFLAAVKECSGPDLNMAFFISYNPEDIIRQAEESTLRYKQESGNGQAYQLGEQYQQLLYRKTLAERVHEASQPYLLISAKIFLQGRKEERAALLQSYRCEAKLTRNNKFRQ